MALGSARGGSSWTVFANLNSKQYQSELREMGVATKATTKDAESGFMSLNAAIAAGTAGLVAFGAQGVESMRTLRAEMLQVQYLFADMERSGRMVLESQARQISGIAGVGEDRAAQLMFRLASTGTPSGSLLREGLPIARAAAALQTDPGGLALATGQGANLAKMSRTDYLNLLISTAGVSTSDISGLRALAPRALAAGNVAGLGGVDTLGLLAQATQVTGSPEEAATGLAALFAEVAKADSKFGKEFKKTFGESFADAWRDQGAEGFVKALNRAVQEWGEEGFFSLLGRRAGMVGTPLAADAAFTLRTVGQVRSGQAGALEQVLEKWEQELPHEFNLLRENINELRLSMVDGGQDSLKSALENLNGILSDQDLKNALSNLGSMMGDLMLVMTELSVVTGALLTPLAKLANVNIGDASLLEIGAYVFGMRRLGLAGRGGTNAASRAGASMRGGGAIGGLLSGGGKSVGKAMMWGGRAIPIAGQLLLADSLMGAFTGTSVTDLLFNRLSEYLDTGNTTVSAAATSMNEGLLNILDEALLTSPQAGAGWLSGGNRGVWDSLRGRASVSGWRPGDTFGSPFDSADWTPGESFRSLIDTAPERKALAEVLNRLPDITPEIVRGLTEVEGNSKGLNRELKALADTMDELAATPLLSQTITGADITSAVGTWTGSDADWERAYAPESSRDLARVKALLDDPAATRSLFAGIAQQGPHSVWGDVSAWFSEMFAGDGYSREELALWERIEAILQDMGVKIGLSTLNSERTADALEEQCAEISYNNRVTGYSVEQEPEVFR